MRFLVVDDSTSVRHFIKEALRRTDPTGEVVEASAAAEALEAFRKQDADLVLLDLTLKGDRPDRSALKLLREMGDLKPQVPIVVVTGLPPDHPNVVAAMSLGARGYLQKPFRLSQLVAILAPLPSEPADAADSYV